MTGSSWTLARQKTSFSGNQEKRRAMLEQHGRVPVRERHGKPRSKVSPDMGAGQLTRSQMNSTHSSQATVFRSNCTSHTNYRAVRFCTGKETDKRKNDHCHLMTMLFGKSLGFQEAKSSKDAKQYLNSVQYKMLKLFLFLT